MFNTPSILREGGSFDDTDIGDAPQYPAIDGIRSNGNVYIWPRVTLHNITQPHCPPSLTTFHSLLIGQLRTN